MMTYENAENEICCLCKTVESKKITFYQPWGSRSCLDRDSRSRHWQRAGLDSLKNDISTNLDNFYAIKSRFLFLSRLSISTFQKPTSRLSRKSRYFKKVSLDAKDVLDLDLDWSRLSRPPELLFTPKCRKFIKALFSCFNLTKPYLTLLKRT